MDANYFLSKLKIIRNLRGLTLRQLAARTSGVVSFEEISMYERGLREPRAKKLEALMMALEIDEWTS